MSVLRRENFALSWLLAIALAVTGAVLASGLVFSVPARSLLIYWIALGGLTLLILYAVLGDLLLAVLLWFFTLICLHEEFWRQQVPLFFAVTIPRLFIVVLVVLFVLMAAMGRIRVTMGGAIGGMMAVLALYFTISAAASGFETHSPIKVHYRLIGGYLFPFTVFALVLNGVRDERSVRRVATFFFFIGLYLSFTGWMEQFKVWALVWPKFIADSTVGIHFGRARGPFVQSAAMGLALTYCYFNNLVLARQSNPVARWLIYCLNLLMLPVIFWTKTRSAWLGFLLCCIVWFIYSRKRTIRALWVAVLIAGCALVAVLNMHNFLSEDRDKGGVTDVEPILVRLGLAQITWRMFEDRPVFGVGFGHFRDYAPQFADDPSSPFYAFASTAMEHNNLLSILAETGLVGLLIYLILLIAILRVSLSLWRRLPVTAPCFINRDLIVLFWILTLAFLTDGFLRETSDNPFANSLFFGLSGVIVALNTLLGPRPLALAGPMRAAPSAAVGAWRPAPRGG